MNDDGLPSMNEPRIAPDPTIQPAAPGGVRRLLRRLARLYETWDSAEPGKGYADKAAQWRGKLDETSKKKRRNAEMSPRAGGLLHRRDGCLAGRLRYNQERAFLVLCERTKIIDMPPQGARNLLGRAVSDP